MPPIQIEATRERVATLRSRLHDIGQLLQSVAAASRDQNDGIQGNLSIAMRAIQAVSDDLETVCAEQLAAGPDRALQQASTDRARSEVDSDEFDSQS